MKRIETKCGIFKIDNGKNRAPWEGPRRYVVDNAIMPSNVSAEIYDPIYWATAGNAQYERDTLFGEIFMDDTPNWPDRGIERKQHIITNLSRPKSAPGTGDNTGAPWPTIYQPEVPSGAENIITLTQFDYQSVALGSAEGEVSSIEFMDEWSGKVIYSLVLNFDTLISVGLAGFSSFPLDMTLSTLNSSTPDATILSTITNAKAMMRWYKVPTKDMVLIGCPDLFTARMVKIWQLTSSDFVGKNSGENSIIEGHVGRGLGLDFFETNNPAQVEISGTWYTVNTIAHRSALRYAHNKKPIKKSVGYPIMVRAGDPDGHFDAEQVTALLTSGVANWKNDGVNQWGIYNFLTPAAPAGRPVS